MLNFFTKALIKRQLKGVPEVEVDKLLEIVEKNPDFFQKMALTVQEKMKKGLSQEQAVQEAIREGGDDVKKVLGQ